MSTPIWQPSTQYPPGSIVSPRSNSVVVVEQPYNNSFESGLTHWTVTGEYCTNSQAQAAVSATTAQSYDGSQSATMAPIAGNGSGPHSGSGNPAAFAILTNGFMAPVVPGQKINFSAYVYCQYGDPNQSFCSAGPRIAWYDSSHQFISYSYATLPFVSVNSGGIGMYGAGTGPNEAWVKVSSNYPTGLGPVFTTALAPKNAAYAAAVLVMSTTIYADQYIYVDNFTWDYTSQGYPTGLVFVATQSATETSGANEPVWPVASGQTVYDPNTAGVHWESEYASSITWTCSSILTSGASQPTWPTAIGVAVADNNIEWTATDGRITDPNCPSTSKIVAIASAKVFAADDDIIRFSATANAQDWTSSQDAGFIPFGLQTYGGEPCAGLGLYRSNLVAFNSLGYQMWQVDPDPNNIAILDAEPVGCIYPKTIQPVNNDLVFCSPVGLRNIGTAGSAGNLQAGQFGKQVDPLVKGLLKLLAANGYEARSLFFPGTGQYWFLVGEFALVLSINGNNVMSWSRYSFPGVITDWTVMDGVLYLRAGDLVWSMDTTDQIFLDDVQEYSAQGGTSTAYPGYMAWNYVACGQEGIDKDFEGIDLTIGEIDDEGEVENNNCVCNVSIGYNQSNKEHATEPYAVTGDTVPGTMIPIPLCAPSFQLRLDFGTGQNWGWAFANLYCTQDAK